jgi:glycerophosphoryl diester phosphodiesterase
VPHNKIATLPEAVALTDSYGSDVRYNIETKVEADKPETSAQPRQFVDVILAAVRSAGKVDKAEIESFYWRTLPMVRQAEPSIPLVALWDDTTWVPESPWTDGGAVHSLGTTPPASMRRSPVSRNYRRVVVNFPSHHIRIAGYRLARLPDSNVCCAQSTKDVQAMSGLAVCRASMSTR